MAWLKGKQISKSHVKGGTTILDFQKKKKCVSLNTMREDYIAFSQGEC